jgi:serine protease Do
VIVSSDGLVLTNRHLVEGHKAFRVTVERGREYPAVLIADDPDVDLALLRIQSSDRFSPARIADSDLVQVGEWVLAIGNPFGLGITLSAGVIGATGRYIGKAPYDALLQSDASINPGNSGGPLFNVRGELVGINSAAITLGQGVGFARPINQAKSLLRDE